MPALSSVPVTPISPERFRPLLREGYAEIEAAIVEAQTVLAGRAVWHVNSTARGGGVAELLRSLLAYARGAGADMRWMTIGGDEAFFRVTKRIHNHLHGVPGDGGELGEAERSTYERALAEAARELQALVREGDVLYLHDPQTAGMIPALRDVGVTIIWRCHIGLDVPNDLARNAWKFLRPYIEPADAYVFSRRSFAWEGLDEDKFWVVAPSIDAFSSKNQELGPETVRAVVAQIGLGPDGNAPAVFRREDGSIARVDRVAEVDQESLIPDDAPLLAQISRWDRLKDPMGVLAAFIDHIRHPAAHLLLAGPAVSGIADDPEGGEVLAEVRAQLAAAPAEARARVHLACLPMEDVEENATMVNAIQRRADVVIQKSLAEGFGLTVAEAMWKQRPVVASRIGGIQDQIEDGVSGILIDDPSDLKATAAAIDALLDDPDRAEALGSAARQRVLESFLGTRHLLQYLWLLEGLLKRD